MSPLQIAALVVLLIASVLGQASRLAARQEAKYLRATHPERAEDPRLDTPEVTLHPAADVDRLWGSRLGLPATLRGMIGLHRAVTTIAVVAGAVLLLTLVFGK